MSISDWSSDVCSSDLTWLEREGTVLRAYVAGISARLFTQRATAILSADIFALPYPEDEDLDLSQNERIIAEDIIAHQRDFIRLGTAAPVMRVAPAEALDAFDEVFTNQINDVYSSKPLRAVKFQHWSGAIQSGERRVGEECVRKC